jgi:hypothetical protein
MGEIKIRQNSKMTCNTYTITVMSPTLPRRKLKEAASTKQGRPKKYDSLDERRKAKSVSQKEWRKRKREAKAAL